MKFFTLSPIVALLISEAIALPARIPTSSHVPVSNDPSPPRPFPKYSLDGGNPLEERDPLSRFPTDGEKEAADPSPSRPFPAGRIVEVKDPSPPSLFPTYPLVEGNPLEERVPLALSRFPTDGEDEAHDPSPPRPFPAGRIVEVEKASPPLEQREPSEPHKLVETITAVIDTASPSPSPGYSLDGGNLLEERDPLSRFPTDNEKEAADPSPPRPFPLGRLGDDKNPPRSEIIEPRIPPPLLRTTEGSQAEANDPSPPRPFPAGRLVEANDSSPSDTIEPRTPSPLLRTTEGSEAEANDPSPPRPFPAGHPADIEPRAEDLPPHRGHGGYFPPSNPPASEPTAPAMDADFENADLVKRRCPVMVKCPESSLPPFADAVFDIDVRPSTTSASTAIATILDDRIAHRYLMPPHIPIPTRPLHTNIPTAHHRIPFATAFAPPRPTSTSTSTSASTSSTTITATITTTPPPSCTTTITSIHYHHLHNVSAALTVHNATATFTRSVDCGGCALTVRTLDVGNNGPQVSGSRSTVTVERTRTVVAPVCSGASEVV